MDDNPWIKDAIFAAALVASIAAMTTLAILFIGVTEVW
jgi:hypothetical protein